MFKKYISIALLLTLVVCQPAFASSMGDYSRTGAFVGKVITYDQQKDKYIVFGRLSLLTENGYRVYETGKFYSVCPDTKSADKLLKENIGKGIKAFGIFEAVKQTTNQETLVAKKVEKYDPSMDSGVLEPAYGPGIGPEPWIGFGVPISGGTARMMTIQNPWDFVWMAESFKRLLPNNNLILQMENKKHPETLVKNTITKETYKPEKLAELLTSEIIKTSNSQTGNTTFKKPYHQFWQNTFKEIYLMEKDNKAYHDILRSIKGWTFIETQKGRLNHLAEKAPVIRPEMDIFMNTVEQSLRGTPAEFSKWAAPSLFYGNIQPQYEWKEINGKLHKVYIGSTYTGPYYSESNQLIDAITHATKTKTLPSTTNNNIEYWKIGWVDAERNVESITEEVALDAQKHTNWFIGTRILVYEITFIPDDPEAKSSTTYKHLESGNMEEGTFKSASGTTIVKCIGHYIKPWIDCSQKISSILSKPEYNYLLSALRDISLKGGF